MPMRYRGDECTTALYGSGRRRPERRPNVLSRLLIAGYESFGGLVEITNAEEDDEEIA